MADVGRDHLDTLTHFETPEGVVLRMSVAGPVPRALAWLIDALIRYTLLFIIAMITIWLGDFGTGLLLLSMFLLEWLYPVVFEVQRLATPGKQRMGLMVVHEDGTPLSWGSSMIRNLLRVVDFLPALYMVGLLSMMLTGRFQRLGDLAAGTLVIHAAGKRQARELPTADALPLPLPLSPEEEQAILDYAERSARLSPSRNEELAQHLFGELTLTNETAHQRVLRYANALSRS